MIFKTKLLLSLGALGVVGGTGTGIYYLKNKNNPETTQKNSEKTVPAKVILNPEPASLPASVSGKVNTVETGSSGGTQQNTAQQQQQPLTK